MKKTVVLLLAIVATFTLVACSSNESSTLNWNIGAEPLTLDPTLNAASDGGDVINNTFEGLVREREGEVVPGIAESWDVSEDGTTYTFHLRESKWSDGSDLVASDFVYGFMRAIDQRNGAEYSWIWEYTNVVGVVEAMYADLSGNDGEAGTDDDLDPDVVYPPLLEDVGISAPDDYTLVMELNQPTSWFISLMAYTHFMPVKASSVEDEDGADGAWARTPDLAVSNGPFYLTEYETGDHLVLSKNPNYWNADEVKLETIVGKFIDNESTAYDGYVAGDLDAIPSVPLDQVPNLIATDDEYHVFPLLGTYYYSFNLTDEGNPVYQNAKLRKALAYAIDRESIVATLGAGQLPAAGFVPTGFAMNFTDEELTASGLTVDFESGDDFSEVAGTYGIASDDSQFDAAVTLFAEAADELGMTVAQLQAAVADDELYFNTSDAHESIAQLLQESWNQVLGIEFDLRNAEWAVFQEDRIAGDFDIARGGWITDYMDPSGLLGIFTSTNTYNDPKYSSAEFDGLMAQASAATNPVEHFNYLFEAQEILITDMPFIPIYHYTDALYIKDYVVDWSRSVLGAVDFSQAYIDK